MRLSILALAALTASASVAASSSHKHKRGSCPKRGHKNQKVLVAATPSSDASSSESATSTWVAVPSASETMEWKVAPTDDATSLKKENPKKEQKEEKEQSNNDDGEKKEEWSNTASVSSSSSSSEEAWTSSSSSSEWTPEPTSSSSSSSQWAEPTPEAKKPAANKGSSNGGLPGSKCGGSGATSEVTKTSGPNGAMSFLNCGLYDAGWTPPELHVDNIQVWALDEALEEDNSPFKPCAPYLHLFNKYAGETGIPPILIASIAMQESTCNPKVTGGGGERGMMQITQEKCTDGIDCYDPDYNIKTGSYYLKSRLDSNHGNILLALGQYNGWYEGLTVAKATAIKGSCCKCQNNLNYMQQMLNGWAQNIDGHSLGDWDMGC